MRFVVFAKIEDIKLMRDNIIGGNYTLNGRLINLNQ